MAKEFYDEFRSSSRWQITRMPGHVITAMSKTPFECTATNVSAKGLSVLSRYSLLPETEIILVVGDMELNLSMVWCVAPDRNEDQYQYGFKLRSSKLNLVELFMTAGCINVRVLVVDDDADVSELFADSLRECGYQVARAGSGKEALAYLEEHPIDLIVSDALMPNGNGLYLYKTTRSRKIPFVVITGRGPDRSIDFPPEVSVIDKANLQIGLLSKVVTWICANNERSQGPHMPMGRIG